MKRAPEALAILVAVSAIALAAASQPAPPSASDPPKFNRDYLHGPPPAIPVPSWAFAMDPPSTSDLQHKPGDDIPRHLPGSTQAIPRGNTLNLFGAVDWHPNHHPPAPTVVMYGDRSKVLAACAFCHKPSGQGLPENAPLAGLSADYIVQQIHDYQNGSRRSADMRMASFHGMADYTAKHMSDADAKAAADYYASLKLAPYIKVVEAAQVPCMHSIEYTMMPIPGGGTEPIGNRILETPADLVRFDLADSEQTFIAYVPPGSIKRGEVLVKTGAGRTLPCVTCHGADLKGVGDIPPLAGRGPSNLVRQLYDIKLGARSGPDVQLMGPVVKNLSDEDIVDVVAYLASRKP